MKKDIVIVEKFDENPISFTINGWFNATEAGKKFGKEPYEFLRLPSTEEYIIELHKNYSRIFAENQELSKTGIIPELKVSEIIKQFVKTKRGRYSPGTWFHPRLGIFYARWLSAAFAVWCDFQIERILAKGHPKQEWFKEREQAAASFQAMCAALKFRADSEGKKLEGYHYANEALLVNEILFGRREPVDWDKIDDKILLKARKELNHQNAILVAAKVPYEERKRTLITLAKAYGTERISGETFE